MTDALRSDEIALVRAIIDDRLSDWAAATLDDPDADPESHRAATCATETCATIRASTERAAEPLASALRAARVDSTVTASDQRHTLRIDVAASDAEAAIMTIEGLGYRRATTWAGGAARSFLRFGGGTILTRTEGRTSVVDLRWHRPTASRSRPRAFVDRVVVPTAADWAIVDLPERLWWVYGALRPFRLVAERLGLVSDDHGDLEPFLVTPDTLLDPLFDVAELDESDVFTDVGCGDGRIVCAAARRHGCRALGVDRSAEAVATARRRVDDAGLADRVRILHADAHDVDLSDTTVALFFVPMSVAVRIVPTVLGRMSAGGRVVLHEQSELDPDLPSPTRTTAIIAADAVTVAHRWDR